MFRPLTVAAALALVLLAVPAGPSAPAAQVQATHVPICWTTDPLFDDSVPSLCFVDCIWDAITSGQVKRVTECFAR